MWLSIYSLIGLYGMHIYSPEIVYRPSSVNLCGFLTEVQENGNAKYNLRKPARYRDGADAADLQERISKEPNKGM